MSATFTAYPDEASWLEARRSKITSSDLPVILGLLDNVSPFGLWLEKTGQGEPRESSYLMRRGHGMEDFIAAEYARETGGVELSDPGGYTVAAREWRGATVDRLIHRLPEGDEFMNEAEGILEIKAPTPYGMHKYADGPDKYVVAQVQWQMHVTGLAVADVAVDLGTRLEVFRINANPALQEALEREALRFREYVTTNTPPPPDGHPQTAQALAAFFAEPVEETVVFDAEGREWFDRRKAAINAVDQYAAERAEAENWFRRELGQATVGNAPDLSYQVTWRPDKNGTRRIAFKEIDA